jgi:hypothetical protein
VFALQEFELSGMRDRFLAVSNEIANELAVLSRRIGDVPPALRVPLIFAAGQIAQAQERLRIEADRLVGLPAQRAAIMEKVLQVQEGAFRHLKVILQQHGAITPNQVAVRAQQMAVNYYAPTRPTVGKMTDPGTLAPYPVQRIGLLAADSDAIDSYSWIDDATDSLEPMPDKAPDGGRRRPNRGKNVGRTQATGRLLSIAGTAGSRSIMLVIIVAVGLSIAYANFPRASDQRGVAVPIKQRARQTQPTDSMADRNAEARSAAPVPEAIAAAPERWLPPPQVPTMQAAPSNSAPAEAPAYAPAKAPSAGAPPATSIAAMPSPPAPPPGTTSPAAEQFVPVVFTHQDKGTAQRAFVELRQQYPKLLQHRQSELQPVDVGKKGLWYRLVVLPPASRQQATETCSRLAAAGYDRCWVKTY